MHLSCPPSLETHNTLRITDYTLHVTTQVSINVSFSNLRLITLVEALLREMWISLIDHRINTAIPEYHLLHPSRHGYLPERGAPAVSHLHYSSL